MVDTPKPTILPGRERPVSPFHQIADGILNLLYPELCFICAHPVSRHRDSSVCGVCWARIGNLRIRRPWCASCGLPFPSPIVDAEQVCGKCGMRTPSYSGARSYGYYEAELSSLIRGFKFHHRRNLLQLLAHLLVDAFHESWEPSEFDCAVPIPLHWRRKRERGFNQSALLAKAMESLQGLPCFESALSRIRATTPQVGLTDAARLENLKGAFMCRNPESVAGKRVLLVDDVMTTGATVESASLALLRAGALRVSVLTVARAVPNG